MRMYSTVINNITQSLVGGEERKLPYVGNVCSEVKRSLTNGDETVQPRGQYWEVVMCWVVGMIRAVHFFSLAGFVFSDSKQLSQASFQGVKLKVVLVIGWAWGLRRQGWVGTSWEPRGFTGLKVLWIGNASMLICCL